LTTIPLRRIEGKYEILEKIREGGMGAIYKVRHRLLDEIRVIKLMRQQLVEDEELKARFLREARLAIKLRHPNIAQLYDFTVDDDGTAFIVMEFIDGMTLEDVLGFHGPPPLGLALEIAQQSLKALGYLHTKGFIHRDISPDNLMLTGDMDDQPLVKLIDLGIARTLEVGGESNLTQAGTFLGKIRYASPEQFGADGATTVDARGDLYSFGIVLYELLTARFPIQGRDASSLIAGHLFRPPLDFAETDPGGRLVPELRAVVLKALAKSPADRFPSALELSRALAVFRTLSDIPEEALRGLLARPFVPAGVSSLPDSGSTQNRLDQHFELAATPSPGSLVLVAKPVAETPGTVELPLRRTGEERKLAEALAEALVEIKAALEKRSYRAAESLLYAAEASFGTREEFAPLYEEVAQERREDLEAKARATAAARAEAEAARERQEEIASLIATARDLAARDDFKGALRELRRAARLDPASMEVSAQVEEIEAASLRQAEIRKREQQVARDVKKIEERLGQGDLDGAEKLLDKAGVGQGDTGPFEELRERLAALRRAERRAQALTVAVAEIREALDRGEQETAGALLDRAVVRFGAAEALREQWERLERMRAGSKAEAARRKAAEEKEIEGVFEAAQEIADLLSRREARQALQELHKATDRFGDRGEFVELRKRIAALLLNE
jgi:serine/threonine protein kinase